MATTDGWARPQSGRQLRSRLRRCRRERRQRLPIYWLITFLQGIVARGALSAPTDGGFRLSGVAQLHVASLNVSSLVVVAAMVAGYGSHVSLQAESLGSHLRPASSEIPGLSQDGSLTPDMSSAIVDLCTA